MVFVRTWIFAGLVALGLALQAPVARAQDWCSSSNGTGNCLGLIAAPFIVVVMIADAMVLPAFDLMTPPFPNKWNANVGTLQGVGIFEAVFCGAQALTFGLLATNAGVVNSNYPSATSVILGVFAVWTGILATHGLISAIAHSHEVAEQRERERGHPGETVISTASHSAPGFAMAPGVGGRWPGMAVVASF